MNEEKEMKEAFSKLINQFEGRTVVINVDPEGVVSACTDASSELIAAAILLEYMEILYSKDQTIETILSACGVKITKQTFEKCIKALLKTSIYSHI